MKIGPGITVLEVFKIRKVSTKSLGAQLVSFSLYRLVIRSPLPSPIKAPLVFYTSIQDNLCVFP